MNTDERVKVYQIISFLLEYPTAASEEILPDIKTQTEFIRNHKIQSCLRHFVEKMETSNLDDWCDQYIDCFDFGRTTNLYVTYSKLGEQRQRGIELLKLKEFYQTSGFDMTNHELSDYLPLMLEFCVHVSKEKSNELLTAYTKEIMATRDSLKKKESDFAVLFDALLLQMEDRKST